MSNNNASPRVWFKKGKAIPAPQLQYTYFTGGFRKDPAFHPWAWAGIGFVWLKQGNISGAVDAFEKALELKPQFQQAIDGRKAACDALEEAKKILNPDKPKNQRILPIISEPTKLRPEQILDANEQEEKHKDIDEVSRKLLEFRRDLPPDVINLMEKIRANTTGIIAPPKAVTFLESPQFNQSNNNTVKEQVIDSGQGNAVSDGELFNRAETLLREKRPDEAVEVFREIVRIADRKTSLVFGKAAGRLALILANKQKYGEAWQLAHDALTSPSSQDNPEVQFWAYYAIEEIAIFWGLRDSFLSSIEKLRHLSKQLEIDVFRKIFYLNISMRLAVAGFYKETLEDLQEAISYANERPDFQLLASLLLNRFSIFDEMGRIPEAIQDAKQASEILIKQDPTKNAEWTSKMLAELDRELAWFNRMTTGTFDPATLECGGIPSGENITFPEPPDTIDKAMQCIFGASFTHGYGSHYSFEDPRGRTLTFFPALLVDEIYPYGGLPPVGAVIIIEKRTNLDEAQIWQGQFPYEPTIREMVTAFYRGEDLLAFKAQMLHIFSDHPVRQMTPENDAHFRRRRLLHVPSDWLTAAHMGYDLLMLKDITGAIKCVELASQQEDASKEVHNLLVTLYLLKDTKHNPVFILQNTPHKALEKQKENLPEDPGYNPLWNQLAIAKLKEMLQKDPEDKELWNQLAACLLNLEPPACDEAIAACNKALKIDPNLKIAKINLVYAEEKKGNKDTSRALVKSILIQDYREEHEKQKRDHPTKPNENSLPPNTVKVKGEFYTVDEQTKALNLGFLGIESIEEIQGLNQLMDLQELYLHKNYIREIAGLDMLRELKVLNLSDNEIEKIEGLSAQHQLEKLFLGMNKIVSIENLDGCTSLYELDLESNHIKKIEGLQILTSLQKLTLGNRTHVEFTTLDGDNQVQIIYHPGQNTIAKIEGLDDLRDLQELLLSKLKIQKIEGLEALENLINLELDDNEISRIEGLDALKRLTRLNINGNPISEIEGLANLSNLKVLSLGNTRTPKDLREFPAQELVNLCRRAIR